MTSGAAKSWKKIALAVFLGILTASCGGGGGSTGTPVNVGGGTTATVNLVALQISPTSSSVANGTTVQFTALGIYSNGSTQDVTSATSFAVSNATIATITPQGLATGQQPGVASITATSAGVTATTTLTVTSATLSRVAVTPPSASLAAGTTAQLRLVATFSDGSTQDLTSATAWSSSSNVASVSNLGLLSGVRPGTATVTAAYGGKQSWCAVTVTAATLTSLNVSPAGTSIANGTTQQLTVTATFSDGTTQNVTSSVTYASSNSAVASVSSGGLVSGLAPGNVSVQATLLGVSGTASLQVSSARLATVSVSPVSATLARGTSSQFRALATFSDGSSQDITSAAVWVSGDSNLLAVTNLGVVSGLNVGSSNVTAFFGGVLASSNVTVSSATLVSLSLSPAAGVIASGTSEQLVVTGTFSDGSTQDLSSSASYTTSNSGVASVSSSGSVAGRSPGTATLRATVLGVGGSTQVTVTSASLSSISITPAGLSLAGGTSAQLHLLADFSDGSFQDLTSAAVWSSANTTTLTVSTLGVVTAANVGAANITATYGGLQATRTVTVTPAVLASVAITPASAVVSQSGTVQLHFVGTLTDGSTQDLSDVVNWTSSNTTLVTVDTHGLATATNVGVNIGLSTVSVAFGGFSATAAVNVIYFASPQQQLDGCIANLNKIAVSIEEYSTDNAGRYPRSMDKLVPNYLAAIPFCPAAGFDTYSSSYQSGTIPDAYTIYCSGLHHAAVGYPANFPFISTWLGLYPPPGVPLPPMTPAQQLTTCQQNERLLAVSAELYSNDNQGHYPPTLALLVPTYLRALPQCPAAGADTYSQAYRSATNPDSYTIYCSGSYHAALGIPTNYPQFTSRMGALLHP